MDSSTVWCEYCKTSNQHISSVSCKYFIACYILLNLYILKYYCKKSDFLSQWNHSKITHACIWCKYPQMYYCSFCFQVHFASCFGCLVARCSMCMGWDTYSWWFCDHILPLFCIRELIVGDKVEHWLTTHFHLTCGKCDTEESRYSCVSVVRGFNMSKNQSIWSR